MKYVVCSAWYVVCSMSYAVNITQLAIISNLEVVKISGQ